MIEKMTKEAIAEDFKESYDWLNEKFSRQDGIKVTPELEAELTGLPQELIDFWKKNGINSFEHGLWWHVNPRDFDGVVEEWLIDTPYWDPDNNPYHVIGRNAFGTLELWGEKTGLDLSIDPMLANIYHSGNPKKSMAEGEPWRGLSVFIAGEPKDGGYDITDNSEKPLFDRALKRFGALSYNEMYTFAPPPFIDDTVSIRKMQKEDLFVHLSIVRQMVDQPNIIDFDEWDKELGL